MRIVSPLCWVGGKYALARQLVSMFPDHNAYVEVFGGAAHVLFRKQPSRVEVYNDIDNRLVNFFRVVSDKKKCDELFVRIDAALYSRNEFDICKRNMDIGSDIDRAYCFAVVNKQSFGSKMETWGVDVAEKGQTATFANLPEKIRAAHDRVKAVQIESRSFEYILNKYDRARTFFYLDPPYPFTGERGSTKVYKHEMADDDHLHMVDRLLRIKGKAMLSSYNTPLYEPLEQAGWKKIRVSDVAITVNRKTNGEKRIRKTEYVWVNY